MNVFLDKHLQLVNKNNIIEIKLGAMLSNNIFNGSIKYDIIKKIIKCINDTYPHKYRSFQKKTYCKRNEEISISNNEICYYILNNKFVCFEDNLMLIKTNIKCDSIIIPSYESFDHIKNHEIIEFTINKMFICNITLEDGQYYVNLVIYKPCNRTLLDEFIHTITNLH